MELALIEPRAVEDEDHMAKRRLPIEPVVDDLAEQAAEIVERHRAPRSDWSRVIQTVSAVLSVGAIVFSAGILWNEVGALKTRIRDNEIAIQQIIKQQNDQNRDTAVLIQKLDEVSRTVAKIEGQLQRPTGAVR